MSHDFMNEKKEFDFNVAFALFFCSNIFNMKNEKKQLALSSLNLTENDMRQTDEIYSHFYYIKYHSVMMQTYV